MTVAYGADEARGLWIYLEHDGNRLANVTRELLGRGRQLAAELGVPITGLLLGAGSAGLAEEAIACGADAVLVADHRLLAQYTTDAHARVVTAMVLDGKPEVLLLGATADGRDLAGRLAVRLRTGLTADCIDLRVEPETRLLLGEVVGFGGGIMATIKCAERRPQMATVRPGVFPVPEADSGRRGVVQAVDVRLSEADVRTRVLARRRAHDAGLSQARWLVVGGGGTRGDFTGVQRLAEALGGAVGATRVAVDAGWAEPSQQIGQTGILTRPRLAIVCGASGATQFTVGIDEAETVVAVNADPTAPIFESADYCLVGDLGELLPALIQEIQALRAAEMRAAG